ncbi:MAG: hypothetical protein JXR78_01600 [Victivallales bacterium]|nr:hypothetical protein [Victivallales bacterium]
MKENFREWYRKKVKENGNLVTPATAARLLEISTQHLNRIIELGRIKRYYFNNIPYIGMNDINREIVYRYEKKNQNIK